MTAPPYIFRYNGEIITGFYALGNRLQCTSSVVQYWLNKTDNGTYCIIKGEKVEILQHAISDEIKSKPQYYNKNKRQVKKRIGNLELTYSMNTGRLVHTRSVK
jgi:hypothetical protein